LAEATEPAERLPPTDVYSESRKWNPIEERAFPAFFTTLAETGMYSRAARSVGWSQESLYSFRRDNIEFQTLCDQALERYRDVFIVEAKRRAVDGCDEPIVSAGQIIGTKKVFSDRLIELFMKRHDHGFRDNKTIEVTGQLGMREAMDLRSLSPRCRVKLRELLGMIKEDRALAALDAGSIDADSAVLPASFAQLTGAIVADEEGCE